MLWSNPNGADWTPGLMTGEPRMQPQGIYAQLSSADPVPSKYSVE